MRLTLSGTRGFASVFFQAIVIAVTIFYYSSQASYRYQTELNYKPLPEFVNPVLFIQSSESTLPFFSFPKFQLFSHSHRSILPDLPLAELFTNEAINIPSSLRSVFYVLVSIHAP